MEFECKKCGWKDAAVEFVILEKPSIPVGEFLRCRCNRCGYTWRAKPKDSK